MVNFSKFVGVSFANFCSVYLLSCLLTYLLDIQQKCQKFSGSYSQVLGGEGQKILDPIAQFGVSVPHMFMSLGGHSGPDVPRT